MTVNKEFIINAICGMSIGYSVEIPMLKRGLMIFTGDGHNESFKWSRNKLMGMSEDELMGLYDEIYQINRKGKHAKQGT